MQTRLRVTRIGWIALVVSIVAAAGTYALVSMLAYSDTADDGGWARFGGWFFLPAMIFCLAGIPTAIALSLVAGFRGRPNQIAGLLGGLLLLVPIALVYFIGFPAEA